MGALAADLDRDGDTDLFVGNDSQPNFYFVNDGTGVFTEDAVFSGVAYDRSGTSNGNMGVECRDINADGQLDLVCTTYQDELPVLYQNQGDGFFDDLTNLMNIDRTLHPHVNWGLGVEDFNKDANLDLYIACGHFMDNIHAISDATQMNVRDYVQFGGPTGKLAKASPSHLADAPVRSARGAAFADLDGDGDQDVVVLNANDRPTLLDNRFEGGNWLQVRLIGMGSNRDAAGALIQCEAAEKTQVAAVHLGRGYQSHYGQEVFFGLGTVEAGSNVTVRVQWPSGGSTEYGVERTSGRITCFESGLMFKH